MHENDVLGFDVAMKDFFVVEVGDGLQDVADYDGGGLFGEPAQFVEFLVELPIASQLEDDVHIDMVLIRRVELHDIWMQHGAVYLYFPLYKLRESFLIDLFFIEQLKRREEPRRLMPSITKQIT